MLARESARAGSCGRDGGSVLPERELFSGREGCGGSCERRRERSLKREEEGGREGGRREGGRRGERASERAFCFDAASSVTGLIIISSWNQKRRDQSTGVRGRVVTAARKGDL